MDCREWFEGRLTIGKGGASSSGTRAPGINAQGEGKAVRGEIQKTLGHNIRLRQKLEQVLARTLQLTVCSPLRDGHRKTILDPKERCIAARKHDNVNLLTLALLVRWHGRGVDGPNATEEVGTRGGKCWERALVEDGAINGGKLRGSAKRVHSYDTLNAAILVLKGEAALGVVKDTFCTTTGKEKKINFFLISFFSFSISFLTYWRGRKRNKSSRKSHPGKDTSPRS